MCKSKKWSNISDCTFCDSCCQGGLAVINMANCSNIHMRLVSAVCLLGICSKGPPTQRHSTLHGKDRNGNYLLREPCYAVCRVQFVCVLTNLNELCRRLGEESWRAEKSDWNWLIFGKDNSAKLCDNPTNVSSIKMFVKVFTAHELHYFLVWVSLQNIFTAVQLDQQAASGWTFCCYLCVCVCVPIQIYENTTYCITWTTSFHMVE